MRQKHRDMLPGYFHDVVALVVPDQLNDDNDIKTLHIVRQFRDEYKRIDEQLTKYPTVSPNPGNGAAKQPGARPCTAILRSYASPTSRGIAGPNSPPKICFAQSSSCKSKACPIVKLPSASRKVLPPAQ